MKTIFFFLFYTFLSIAAFAQSAPQLIWHQDYGDPEYNQRVSVSAIDPGDNLYVAGYVYFGTYGNVLVNKYDPFGNLLWNRVYDNTYPSPQADKPVAIYPDINGGAAMVAYLHHSYSQGHLYHYNSSGAVDADYFFGDTTLGNTTPVAAINNANNAWYMFGQLNGTSKVFMCNDSANIIWSQTLKNNYNSAKGSIQFDAAQNIVLGVFDSVLPQIVIHRYNKSTGLEMQVFNTQIDSLPLDSMPIQVLVDGADNIFVAGTGTDGSGQLQLSVHKFDTLGNVLWAVQCPSARGHLVPGGVRFKLANNGNVLMDGTYNDNNDTLQYVEVYQLSNSTGAVLWTAIDTGAFVKGGALSGDIYSNVYLGTLKAQLANSNYSLLSFTAFSADSGATMWNRSFDNGENNATIQMQLNNSGDIFFSCTTLLNSLGGWFMGRVGNAANDVEGIAVIPSGADYMQIMPNPFSNSTLISFSSPSQQKVQLKVFDLTGQLLDEQELEAIEGNNTAPFKAALAPGMYIFRLKSGNNYLVQKAVVY